MNKIIVCSLSLLLILGFCYAEEEQSNYTVTWLAWFNVEVKNHYGAGEDYTGKFVIGLFGDTVPMTVMNFVKITEGYTSGSQKLRFKNSNIHRIVPDFVIQMGDITAGDGTGGRSIFGDKFNDENFFLSHKAAGYVSMANHGPDTNGSQFFILLNAARWLDNKHVVFGKIVDGMDTVKLLGNVEADFSTAVPKKRVKITDCGVEELKNKYSLTEDEILSDKDIDVTASNQ
ncbi:peptidyl-prolyl cis-trans isomerase [Octopus sinensis]|uniref:Peptidyl-prolyl cis-trans isomerase n=1 Tax=Octopus sinensis TaxID=2607531 RepID=A0A6P7TGU8_9MOLL|nr:peptidyl-prolyl cis-trans isomerase [Octopus sinensis]